MYIVFEYEANLLDQTPSTPAGQCPSLSQNRIEKIGIDDKK
jgi:hypothetical protein